MVCGAIERDFKFWMPLEVTKSSKGDMRVGGVATDENAQDLQGEKVFVRGLDTSYLSNRGVFNWNHGKEPGDILGEIDIVQKNVDKGTLYVEGYLYPGVRKATDTYNLMRSLKDSGSTRQLGLSVEGKVKERDTETGKQIKKAWIRAVAITYDPINQGTFLSLIKSFGDSFTFEPCKGDCSHCSFCECEEDTKKSDGADPRDTNISNADVPLQTDPRDPIPGPDNVCPKCGKYKTGAASDEICMCDMPVATEVPDAHAYVGVAEKAISAGHDIPATSGGVSGSALRDEDLEKDPKVTTYDERHLKDKKKKKVFTKSEVIDLLKEKGIDNPELFTDCIFKAMDLGKSDFSRFGPRHEKVAMCENSSRGTGSIGIPKCYDGKQEHEVKVIYHDNPFNESGTTHDILNLCTDCMKRVKQDAESHGYRVEVTPIKHRKEQWTRRRAGQIEIVHRRRLSKAEGIRDIFNRMQSEGKVKGHLRRTKKGTTGWVKPHKRMLKEDQQYKRTLESAVGPWLDARDKGETKPFAQWIKEKDPKTYSKLIEGIGGQN